MKKSILTLGVAFLAFTGVFAQVETETETKQEGTETEIENQTQMEENFEANPEQAGKVEVTYQELPAPIQEKFTETEIEEAYKVEANAEAGIAESKFEVHVKDDQTAEAKVVTFDEQGKELEKSDSEY